MKIKPKQSEESEKAAEAPEKATQKSTAGLWTWLGWKKHAVSN